MDRVGPQRHKIKGDKLTELMDNSLKNSLAIDLIF